VPVEEPSTASKPEVDGAEIVFEIAQAAAECRLPNIERLGGLSKASMLGRDNRLSQIAKLHAHSGIHTPGQSTNRLRWRHQHQRQRHQQSTKEI
jgi:hypothetical protein